jgi:hypothetical protein
MNTIKSIAGLAAAAALCVGAAAQTATPGTTEQARDAASRATYAAAMPRAFEKPVPEEVSAGDYRAEWRNNARVANHQRFHRELQAHVDGERSTPIAVVSGVQAQDEAARVREEQEWAGYAAHMKSSPKAQVEHRVALSEQGPLAGK